MKRLIISRKLLRALKMTNTEFKKKKMTLVIN